LVSSTVRSAKNLFFPIRWVWTKSRSVLGGRDRRNWEFGRLSCQVLLAVVGISRKRCTGEPETREVFVLAPRCGAVSTEPLGKRTASSSKRRYTLLWMMPCVPSSGRSRCFSIQVMPVHRGIDGKPAAAGEIQRTCRPILHLQHHAWRAALGAEKSARRADNLSAIEHFVARLDVLAFEAKAAAHYGQVRAELERAGAPCGPHDMQIGGHARSEGLIVVTNNMREFSRMPGIRAENWV